MSVGLIPPEYIVSGGIGLLLFTLYVARELARAVERIARLEAKLDRLLEELERGRTDP